MPTQEINGLSVLYPTPLQDVLLVEKVAGSPQILFVFRDENGFQVTISLQDNAARSLALMIQRALPNA